MLRLKDKFILSGWGVTVGPEFHIGWALTAINERTVNENRTDSFLAFHLIALVILMKIAVAMSGYFRSNYKCKQNPYSHPFLSECNLSTNLISRLQDTKKGCISICTECW